MGHEFRGDAGVGLALRLSRRMGDHASYGIAHVALHEKEGLVLINAHTCLRQRTYVKMPTHLRDFAHARMLKCPRT